jgi:thiosulfate/3-mercaptopyruvate sulfurtransferase
MSLPSIVSARDLPGLRVAFPDVVLLDARPGRASFDAGHLDGAIYADPNSALSSASDSHFDPARGGRHPLPPIERWTALVGQWGITPATPVVVYDEQDGSNAAARAWWMLRSVGHAAVGILDGGYKAALEAGLSVSTQPAHVDAREPYPARAWEWPTVDMAEVDELRNDARWKVLDVRSAPRFRGETEPIDPIAGHIPGAVNLPFSQNLEDGRFKNAEALRRQYEALLGGTPPQRLIVHCGSGVTACHTLVALELAGLHGASLYVGSWSEWCRNDLPRA